MDVTAQFNKILNTEVLQAVHKAINVLGNDCRGFPDTSYDEILIRKIDELNNTVITFANKQLAVYTEMNLQSKETQ